MLTPLALTQLGRVASIAPHPDGTCLAVAVARLDDDDAAYVHDLWRVPLDGSAAVRLTSGPWNDRAPIYRDDGSLAFLSNRPLGKRPEDGEDKRSQVWLLPAEGGEATRLTDEPLGVNDFRIAGATLACFAPVWPGVAHERQRAHAKERAEHGPSVLRYARALVRHWDHWEGEAAPHAIAYDLATGGRTDLTPDEDVGLRGDPAMELSRDGRRLALTPHQLRPDSRLLVTWIRVIDTASGAVLEDIGRDVDAWHHHPRFSPSGRSLAFQRERFQPERVHDSALVVRTGSAERVLDEGWDRWPIPQAFLDERTLAVTFDDLGEVRIALVDVETGERREIEHPGSHDALRALPGGGLAGIAHRIQAPPRAFVLDLSDTIRELADLSGAGPMESHTIERMGVEASDGATVDVRLALPPGPGPHPLLLWIHGGPIGSFGDGWHWRWNVQTMVDAGYAVALPNARGSTGYGYDFVNGIWGNRWGEQCFDDLMRVTDALAAHPAIDGARMVAMGGSFGGYMSNWIGTQTERFAAIVTHASIYDMRAFYGATDHPAYFGLHNASTPWSGDIDLYSPHKHMASWKTPTLVLHGEKDYRVPISEALALFEGLQKHGVDSELVVFPDENHWILKPRNVRAWYGAVLDFLAKRLG
ncbi:MAG: prolyl oligopeptidase family serine peptidase [Sandaracinaceae bacterium]